MLHLVIYKETAGL